MLWASTPKTQIWSTFKQFSQGDFQNLTLDASGQLQAGYQTTAVSKDLPAGVIAVAPHGNQKTYVATMSPGTVWEVTPGQKPKAVFRLKEAVLTHMFAMPNGELALVSGPGGGVTYVLPGSWTRPRKVEIPGVIYGVHQNDDTLLLVGDNGYIHSVTGARVEKKPVLAPEARLRSVLGNYYGSADTGTVYLNQEPLLKLTGEVVAIAGDPKSKNIFAAVNLSKNASQIWRISPKGDKCMVWESTSEIVYSMKISQAKLVWGTGPTAHLYTSDLSCDAKPSILASFLEHERVVALANRDSNLLVAASGKGALYQVDLEHKVQVGNFKTPVFKLDTPSKIQDSSGELWLGNTDKPDASWWKYDSNKPKLGQYGQVRQSIAANKPVDRVYMSYEAPVKQESVKAVIVSQIEPKLIQVKINLDPKSEEPEHEYEFILESLGEETWVMQPFAKTLSVSYDTSKLEKGMYRAVVYSDKDKKVPASASEWFEVK